MLRLLPHEDLRRGLEGADALFLLGGGGEVYQLSMFRLHSSSSLDLVHPGAVGGLGKWATCETFAHGRNTDKAFTPDDGGKLLSNLGDGGSLVSNLLDDGDLLSVLGDGSKLLSNLGDGGSLVSNLLDDGDLLSVLGKGEVRELNLLGLAVSITSWYPLG